MTLPNRVLVTGGAGYVGSVLVASLLGHGCRVRVLDSLIHGGRALLGAWADPRFEFHRGDIRSRSDVQRALEDVDAVVHLAAIVGDPACAAAPDLAREVNVEASRLLIDESRRAGVERFVFASTCSNYGRMASDDQWVTEDSELRPVSLYAENKVSVEQALQQAADPRFAVTVLRFATVYGVSPRMRFDLTVNEFTRTVIAEGRLVVFGEYFWRPYVHVRDAARAVALVLGSDRRLVDSTVFNVGDTGENYQKRQIVELVLRHRPDATVQYVAQREDPRNYRVDFARITERLGFSITRTVPDGIAEVARLVRDGVIPEESGAPAALAAPAMPLTAAPAQR